MSQDFPKHGPIQCSICFGTPGQTTERGLWKFCNNPGHWGSSNPRVLVLGFNKGATQTRSLEKHVFEKGGFAGCRPELFRILCVLRLLTADDDIDAKFSAAETEFAFASLVRCSMAMKDPGTGAYGTSGRVILKAFREGEPMKLVRNCSSQFLQNLPDRLKLVVMLGVQEGYIKQCRRLVCGLFPSPGQYVNEVAYRAGGATWVHAIHPSHIAKNHFRNWTTGRGNDNGLAKKRDLALKAVGDTELLRG